MNSSLSQQTLINEQSWKKWGGVHRHLHGNLSENGFCIEWHDFYLSDDMDWWPFLPSGCFILFLNYNGQATLGNERQQLRNETLGMLYRQSEKLLAQRKGAMFHRYVQLTLGMDFLRQFAGPLEESIHPEIRPLIKTKDATKLNYCRISRLNSSLVALRLQLLEPPVSGAAVLLWYQAKLMEILAQSLMTNCQHDTLFCKQHQRVNRERVQRVQYLLERDLENPPSLQMLASEVGCSPSHLSRIFTQESGQSLPKYLRIKRIEKAADLLQNGTLNVTETAMAVGYSSLSAFNKAFVEYHGICPGLYPVMNNKRQLDNT